MIGVVSMVLAMTTVNVAVPDVMGAFGPTLGGLMIEYFSWRYVFFISLPFCAIAAVMGLMFMPTRPVPQRIPPFDWLGFGLLCTALFGLMTGIADGQREGWTSDTIV